MAYEQRPGTITLFLNRNKGEKEPDFKPIRGERISIAGEDYEVAVWKRLTKNGDEYLYLSIQEPYRGRE